MFLKDVSYAQSPMLHLFEQRYSKKFDIVKYYRLQFQILLLKAEFSASILQSSVSRFFRNPSMLFVAQETFVIINVENCFFIQ